MANLPADLVDDIILRLSVRSLLRFRCVSKPWLALIDSPNFIKLHLNHSTETRKNRIVVVTELGRTKLRTYSINVDLLDGLVEIDHPLKNSYKRIHSQWNWNWFKGSSCNGLILISYHNGKNYFDDINFIWNPSTRNYQRLPFNEYPPNLYIGEYDEENYDPGDFVSYGLGYDSVRDDYKVVRMLIYFRESDFTHVTEVKVYSLKSNTWRRLHDFSHYIYDDSLHGVLRGGALHWLVCDEHNGDDPKIAAFDVSTEEFHFLPMPSNIQKFCDTSKKLHVLEGCLCIFDLQSEKNDMWVMKCYGVIDSWTKLISVDLLPRTCTDVHSYCQFIIPLAMSKDNTEVLFMHSSRVLISVDLQRTVSKRIDVPGLLGHFQSEFVTQSLVPLGGRGSRTNLRKDVCTTEEDNKKKRLRSEN